MTAAEPFDLSAHIPDCPVMGYMWLGCLQWAISEPEILQRFMDETGCRVSSDVLGRMIDRQTGYNVEVVRRFVEWFHVNVWGPTE